MKSTLKEIKGSIVEGEVALTGEEFSTHWEPAYAAALQNVTVQGFRKGAAPQELAAKHVDVEAVFHAATDRAVRQSLSELTEDNDWRIIDGPSIEILHASPKKDAKDSAFSYKARFTIFPRIEIGNYKKIAADVLSEKKPAEVSAEEVAQSLEWLRGSRATLTAVTREAAKGDVVEIDIESFIGDQPVPGGKLSHDQFVLGESRFIPGFDDALVGKTPSTKAEFTLAAPPDYWEKSLRGKEIRFSVFVRNVLERKLPALDDAFASSLGAQIKTVADLEKNIREGIGHEKEDRERDRLRAKMLEEIGKVSKIDIPEIMLERTLDGLVEETGHIAAQGGTGANTEELRKALKGKAEARVRGYLVIHEISAKEGLEPTEEEITVEASRANVDPKDARDYSYGMVRNRKVFEFLEKSNA